MAKKRRPGPAGKGARRFLKDSGEIHRQIKRGKAALQKAGTEHERGQAIALISNAESSLRELSRTRFEKIAEERTLTALRAMDNIVKLTTQNRYAVILTEQHARAIIEQLRTRFEAVSGALVATVQNQAARQTIGSAFVGVSMFAPGGDGRSVAAQ